MSKTSTSLLTGSLVPLDKSSEDDAIQQLSDEELLKKAAGLFKEDLLLPAARLLRLVKDQSLVQQDAQLVECLRRAAFSEKLRSDLLTQPTAEEGWTKSGESHGNRDFVTYYKIDDNDGFLKCRIESVIESSLYVPFLALMNETDHYESWFPNWNYPFKLGIQKSVKLAQQGRVDQVVQLTLNMPWGVSTRELVFWGYADDDGPANRNNAAKLMSVDEDFGDGTIVPPTDPGVVRMDFESDWLFRPCPPDHPALVRSKCNNYPADEEKILLTMVVFVNPKLALIPKSLINFGTRVCMPGIWNMILRVSEEIRDGKRPVHTKLIEDKWDEVYEWVTSQAKHITTTKKS